MMLAEMSIILHSLHVQHHCSRDFRPRETRSQWGLLGQSGGLTPCGMKTPPDQFFITAALHKQI